MARKLALLAINLSTPAVRVVTSFIASVDALPKRIGKCCETDSGQFHRRSLAFHFAGSGVLTQDIDHVVAPSTGHASDAA